MSSAAQPPDEPERTREGTEKELRASEVRYRRLFETAQDGILILDATTGAITDVNPFLIRLLGYSHSEMIGKTVAELSPFGDLESNQAMLERLQQLGYVRYEDLPLQTREGRRIAVEFVSNVYRSGDETVIQCNIRDITERKQQESTRKLLATAVEQAAETILITDIDGTTVYANPAFEKTTGYTRSEAIGRNPKILKSGKHDAAFYRGFWETLHRGEMWSGLFVNRRKDGRLYDEEATVSPVRNPAGKVINYVAVKRDVTRERQLEARLRQAQKMESIGQLAAGVAHDFNNILAVIQIECDLLRTDGTPSDAQMEHAEAIGTATQRAAALIRQLLLFSRQESIQPRDLDLNQSVEDMTRMLRRILGENINLQLKFALNPLPVRADAGMIDQVLLNLAVNSRDAMPGGGLLVIETSSVEFDDSVRAHSPEASAGSFACLSVSDTGCGIEPDHLSRVFEPFFTTKDPGKGTGLGLATVFGIARQHRGWVNVYSDVGHGTTFRIYFPRLPGAPARIPQIPGVSAPAGHGETVLLVEDDAFLRASVRRTLTQAGYHVLAANNGVEALEVWNKNRDAIRLLLTDIGLPGGVGGKELGERLSREDPKLKVIYASGHSAEVAAIQFSLPHGIQFLGKPFQSLELIRTVRRLLEAGS